MYSYNKKVYGDAGYYIQKIKSQRAGFCLTLSDDDSEKDFKQYKLKDTVEKIDDKIVKLSGKFYFTVYDPDNIKRDLIKLLYNYDEQIAIILNKDESEFGLETYNKMQAWRTYFGNLAKKIKEVLPTETAEAE